jgi:dTDP-4-dehydrorhamnose reductase
MSERRKHILFFGFGYSAEAMARRLDPAHWKISGTRRSQQGADAVAAQGFQGLVFDDLASLPADITHIVTSVPPDTEGDPVLRRFGNDMAARAKSLTWVAYLSTTGVYGDHAGGWVDENTPLTPNTERGRRRLAAETAWLHMFSTQALPVHLFRLAGIYGPARNALVSIRDGTARRVIREGQVFSRIHVEDIAGVLCASLQRPYPGRSYNVADDEPCPPQDVITYAAGLLGVEPPPEIAFEDAILSPMARSFFMDSKRVSNVRVRRELDYVFAYPNYRAGLRALLAADTRPFRA